MSTPVWRANLTKVVAAASVGLLVWAAMAVAGAAPFAGERFAPVTDMSDAPALDVQAITVKQSDAATMTFGVTFSAPFASPTDGYRVSVSVGDPTAKRTRWSAKVADGQLVGVVESGDGVQWTSVGATAAELDPAAGTASITAQPGTVAPGSALWVDAELPTPLGTLGAISTYFSYDALAAPQNDPSIAGTTWGWTRDLAGARLDGAVHFPGAPPTAAILNRALVISSPDAPPTLLLGQPVTSANDYVKFADATAAAPGDGGFVMVNRVTGDVQLFSIKNGVPAVIAGAGQRVVPAGAPPTDAPGTRTVSLDLAAVETELGLPDDPSNVAMSVDRGLVLADGSTVSATGVAATVASLEAVGTTPSESGTPTDVVEPVKKSSSDNVPVALIAAAAVLALVVIGIVATVLLVKRRSRRHESLLAEGWFDRELAARPLAPRKPLPRIQVGPLESQAPSVAEPQPAAEPPAAEPTRGRAGAGPRSQCRRDWGNRPWDHRR